MAVGRKKTLLRRMIGVLMVLAVAFILLLGLYALPVIRPISTLMMKDYALGGTVKRQWVPLDDISPHLVNAVMMAEDGQFCRHYGVDWRALHGEVMRDGGPARGASTISMQTVKNLFLWHGQSYLRKGLEIPLALVADVVLSKRRLMEIYLNIAEWGPGIYGVEAAAQFYFNRQASKLTPRQAALLATALPNPYLRNPANPGIGMNRLANLVERRARRSGAYVRCLN